MQDRRLTRREFMRLTGVATSAALLGACRPRPAVYQVAVTATPSAEPTPVPLPTSLVLVTDTGVEMVVVEPGSFEMGSMDGRSNEQPVHTVSITRPFAVSKYVVTFEQYDLFCDEVGKPRRDDGGTGRGAQPANVTWYDAAEYCNWLSEKEGLTPCFALAVLATECDFAADGYRLATEAEWEYAARGGSFSQGYLYSGDNDPGQVAWFEDNSGGTTHPVGQKAPNELGLYDMSGNMWEWCWDWYGRDYYAVSPAQDPQGAARGRDYMGQQRVRRGGSFQASASEIRVAQRGFDEPGYEDGGLAIRLVRTV
jgi:sulfatase modifying factor 1